jgi:hypothetical protein
MVRGVLVLGTTEGTTEGVQKSARNAHNRHKRNGLVDSDYFLRSQTLYPAELRAHSFKILTQLCGVPLPVRSWRDRSVRVLAAEVRAAGFGAESDHQGSHQKHHQGERTHGLRITHVSRQAGLDVRAAGG